MKLFDPSRTPQVEPKDALLIVHGFLQRCRRWADREVPRHIEQVATHCEPNAAARLHDWLTYIQFTDHTLAELESGRLDHWFTRVDAGDPE